MDGTNGLKETTRVTAPVASNTLGVNVFTAPGKAMVGERPKPFGEAFGFDPITSTLIFGEHDAVLVDAMTTVAEAEALADWVALHNRNLETIYITHAHFDHFYGQSILRAGPHIGTLTPSSTTKRAAPLAALFGEWAPQPLFPRSLVTDKARSSVIDVADADQPASPLRRWIPSLHHYKLLSAKSAAGHAAESRSVSRSLRAGAAAARLRGGWIRCDA